MGRRAMEDRVRLVDVAPERERVRQLESRISGKLRTFLKDSLGEAFEVDH